MLLVAGTTPASAHYVYDSGDVYESAGFDQCVYGYAESSHGDSGNGYMKGTVQAVKSYEQETSSGSQKIDCDNNEGDSSARWWRPSQNLAIRDEYFRLNNNPGDKSFPRNWSLCEYSDWFYNQKDAYKLTIAGEMRGPTICGSSYYGTLANMKVNNGGWLGGQIWSGGHRLPTSPSSAVGSSTGDVGPNNLYAGLDAALAGTTDGALATDGMINPPLGDVTIAGPDGNPLINPATGQPFLVDLGALNTPPTDIPANAFDVATDLAGQSTTVIDEFNLPTGVDTGPGSRRWTSGRSSTLSRCTLRRKRSPMRPESGRRSAVGDAARLAVAVALALGAAACNDQHRDDCKRPGVCFPGGPNPPAAPTPP